MLTNPFEEEMQIARFEIVGTGAPVFWLALSGVPGVFPAQQRLSVPIRFLPTETGPVSGSLLVDLNDQAYLEVRLEGAGSEMSKTPLVELSCSGDVQGTCSLQEPRIVFADTHYQARETAVVRVHNPSWAKLTLFDFSVVADPGTNEFQFIVSPRLELLKVPAGETVGLPMWFYPRQTSDTLAATLSFSTNAPSTPQVSMPLEGARLPSRLRLEPESCDFRTSPPCSGTFSLVNSSAEAIVLGGVWLSPPALPEDENIFRVVRALDPETTIPAGTRLEDAVEVAYTPGRDWQRELTVESSAGPAVARLIGSVPPKAVIEPTRLDFGQDYYLPFTVTIAKQWDCQWPLTIGSLALVASTGAPDSPAFDLPALPVAPCSGQIAANTLVLAGKSVSGCVHFRAPERERSSRRISTSPPTTATPTR